MRQIISGFAVIALLAAATAMLRSPTASANRPAAEAAAVMSPQQHFAPGVSKLPVDEFEDQSLVYSKTPQ